MSSAIVETKFTCWSTAKVFAERERANRKKLKGIWKGKSVWDSESVLVYREVGALVASLSLFFIFIFTFLTLFGLSLPPCVNYRHHCSPKATRLCDLLECSGLIITRERTNRVVPRGPRQYMKVNSVKGKTIKIS